MESLEVYIPPDRRRAMARGETLPNRAYGAVLFADISGFTPLTDALVKELGPRQGVDELTQQLNRVYDALIAEVDRYGGSVIFFSGDAITSWFDGDAGEQAVACALQMQRTMTPFAAVATPSGVMVSLAIKVVVTTGPVRRFLVGDPHIQLLDVLAGQTLDRMARIEHLAQKGEILVGAEVVAHLGDRLRVAEWREDSPVEAEQRSAVVTGLTSPPILQPTSLPVAASEPLLSEAQTQAWLLPPVYERMKAGRGRFLAELRTAVAFFLSFQGLDYDHDDAAGEKLDAYIRWVQNVLAHYEGNLLQLTIGDKGSYLYATFGAPLAHGDDASRAVAAAMELRTLPPALDFISHIQLGLSQGRMRAGAYGSQTRRTYGVLGSEANIAARLMSRAGPGQILVSKHVAEAAAKNFQFTYLETTPIKGRTEPIPIFEVSARHTTPHPRPVLPLGHKNTLGQFAQMIEAVLAGQGQVVRLAGVPRLGQSPLASELVQQAVNQGFQVARGICRNPEKNAAYSPWREMFRTWFDLSDAPQEKEDRTAWTAHQIAQVEATVADTNSDWLSLLPLLGDLLGLPIPDNETTAIFNPILRQGTLFALVMEMVKAWATTQPSLIVIEEAQWLDEAAQGLTLALARSITSVPILLALVHRSPQPPEEPLLPELNRWSHCHQFDLSNPAELPAPDRLRSHKSAAPVLPPSAMIGRQAERMLLAGQLQALMHDGEGATVLIEGEAGIGKSRLVADLLEQAQALGLSALIGGGDAIEQSSPYHGWRPLFRQLFNLDARPNANTVARRTHVLSLLPANPELLRLAPLLNAVLPLGLQENDLTRQMTGQVRADNTRDLLLNLLQGTTAQSPTLIVMEDAHWLDSASWALTRLVSQRVQRALLVVVTRPLTAPLPAGYNQLLQTPGVQRLELEALSPEETLTLVCQRLGVKFLPEPVTALIRAKAEGHPFFSEELAYALRDAGLIRIVEGECRLASEAETFGAISLPNTVEEVITTRIDRLNPPQQLILKVASVIGRTFPVELLRDIHPIETDKPYLPTHLNTLTQLDITRLDTPPPDLAYTFKHAITRDVAYNLMLFDQRRELHRAVAEWFEHTYTSDLQPFYPLLAHHWSQVVGSRRSGSIAVAKAIDYLEKAGEQALRGYANQEAVRFLDEAISLAKLYSGGHEPLKGDSNGSSKNVSRPPTHLRRSRWERQLGEAYLGLGQLAESREHLEQAVAMLGWPQPDQRVRHVTSLLGQVLQQISHRLWPVHLVQADPNRQAVLLEAVRTYERLGEIYYWSNQTLPAIYAALCTLNLAERAGPTPELARAYANMCLVAGFASLRSLAESYSRRAQAAARNAQHHPALAWVLELTGVYAIGVGQWAKARDTLRQGALVAHHLEDHRRWEECATALSEVSFFQGRFAESLKLWPDIYASARRRGDAQAQSWGLAGQLRSLLALGEHSTEQALTILQTLASLLREDIGSADKINSHGVVALLHWRLGRPEQAHEAAEAAVYYITESSPTGFGIIHGYNNAAEVCLALWEAAITSDAAQVEANTLKANAEQTCQALHKFARAFPIGQPRAWLWQGLYEWLSGRPAKARAAWQKSLAAAQRLEMPYEQALALYELGRHWPANDPHRRTHLTRAADIFSQLKARYDLERVQQV